MVIGKSPKKLAGSLFVSLEKYSAGIGKPPIFQVLPGHLHALFGKLKSCILTHKGQMAWEYDMGIYGASWISWHSMYAAKDIHV